MKKWVCNECESAFSQEHLLWEHMSEHQSVFICKICEKNFQDLKQVIILIIKTIYILET